MRVERELAAALLERALERVRHLDGATQGHAEGDTVLEEALQDVQDVRRHRALGREAAKDAHGVDVVAKEGHCDDLVHGLVQRVEGERQVEEDIRMRQNVRRGARRRRDHPRVLAQVDERDSRGRATQRLEPLAKSRPLGDGLVALLLAAALVDEVLELLRGADREAPVALGRPVAQSRVGFALEVLAEHVEDRAQWVERRAV